MPSPPSASKGRAAAPSARTGEANWRGAAISAFIRSDPLLYSDYLLHLQRSRGSFDLDSPESHFAFLLWFYVHGRESSVTPRVVPDRVREAVALPDAAGCHPLMRYVAEQDGLDLRGDALRRWFYLEGVPRYGLAPFLSRAELSALAATARSDGRRPAATELDRLMNQRGAAPSDPFLPKRLAHLAARTAAAPALPRVSIVGLHRSVLGLGEDARCLFDCLTEAGVTAELIDVSPAGFEADQAAENYRAFEATRPTASVLIFCLPAFEMMRAISGRGLGRPPQDQVRIGYWPWETTALPVEWHHVYDFVDEVWASSQFLHGVYAAQTKKPVRHVPPHVRVGAPAMADDLRPLLRNRFTFLSVFDFNSRIERKNPLGSIEAFRRAFPPGSGEVQLLLKTINGDKQTGAFDIVQDAIGTDGRIAIVDGALSGPELAGLMAAADVYLSLHRSEGFGRPLAEAMLLGTPVVATGWSGAADFLDEGTGYPVRSTLRPVGRHEYPFAAGSWAEPDLDHAVELMRHVYAGRHGSPRTTEKARRTVEARHGLRTVAAHLRRLLTDRFGA